MENLVDLQKKQKIFKKNKSEISFLGVSQVNVIGMALQMNLCITLLKAYFFISRRKKNEFVFVIVIHLSIRVFYFGENK
jgi:hypothetical protein